MSERGARDEVDHVSCDNAANIPIHALDLPTGRDRVSESSIAISPRGISVASDGHAFLGGYETATQPGLMLIENFR